MKTIANSVAVLSKFNRSIKFKLVRFGTQEFGFVCGQTGKKMFITWPTRLDAAVGIVRRYFTCQSYSDCAFVNPYRVSVAAGLDMAIDLLISAGFCRVNFAEDHKLTLIVLENYDIAKNQ